MVHFINRIQTDLYCKHIFFHHIVKLVKFDKFFLHFRSVFFALLQDKIFVIFIIFSLILVDTLSLTSEASSMPIDNEFDDLNNRDIESLTQELANRGPQLCEKQIR